VHAQTWTKGAATTNWNTAGNWDNNSIPNSPTVDVLFPSSTPFFFGPVKVNSSVQNTAKQHRSLVITPILPKLSSF